MWDDPWLIVALVLMFIGLVGVILPLVPGIVLVYLAALLYAVIEGFAKIGPITLAVLTVLAVVGVTADLWVSSLGAKVGYFRLRGWGHRCRTVASGRLAESAQVRWRLAHRLAAFHGGAVVHCFDHDRHLPVAGEAGLRDIWGTLAKVANSPGNRMVLGRRICFWPESCC
jgi:hypothetical protein